MTRRAAGYEYSYSVPVWVWPCSASAERGRFSDGSISTMMDLVRYRVEDISEGLEMIRVCGICLRGPTIGAQMSMLPPCGHSFHVHCVARWLLEDCVVCPSWFSDIAFDQI